MASTATRKPTRKKSTKPRKVLRAQVVTRKRSATRKTTVTRRKSAAKGRVGRPMVVRVQLNVQDVANILTAVTSGSEISLNGNRAKTTQGKAVRLTIVGQE